jgi:hypothetical protein
MAIAVIQEFPIEGDDRTTTNYDRIQEAPGTRDNPPDGGLGSRPVTAVDSLAV